ncbi:MAG: hypothetical protein SGJ18_11605 [Pseudomonadota bacterium]|nr:hypothetical protein [Pseudomonadota bacterium]
MIKIMSILALVLGANFSQANVVNALAIQQALLPSFTTQLIFWEVGQKMEHKISVMNLEGSMATEVKKETEVGYWLNQDVSIAGQEQKVQMLISKEDGTILEMIVNGQKQTPPATPEVEILEQKEANITVPAGTYDCLFVKVKDVATENISEVWINPKLIPINGMLKAILRQQGLEVAAELVSFKK